MTPIVRNKERKRERGEKREKRFYKAGDVNADGKKEKRMSLVHSHTHTHIHIYTHAQPFPFSISQRVGRVCGRSKGRKE